MEKELEVQIGMKQEMEMSMKMLEKDICEKQDALMELRQQLEDLRAINQQLLHRSQVGLLQHRTPRNMAAGLSRECSKVQLHLLTFPLQSSDASSKQKSETISRLEEKINQMTGTVKQMEAR